ncbi:MAG: alanine:cation symporter family protein [Clostridiaceae bacterium]|nr:alanine:cation symporter family protein [Clostridiaceae bacterium]
MIVLSNLEALGAALWSFPLPLLLCATHLFLTVRLGFPQRKIGQGIRDSLRADAVTGVHHSFQALAVQLAATLGVGNIVGVALAIIGGGAGAVLWCWLAGLLGIATTYAEARMTLECRKEIRTGGPWDAMGRPLGVFYALVVAIGGLFLGSMIPANTVAFAMPVARPVTAIVLAVSTAFVVLGGAVWIQKACEKLIPLTAALYLFGCIAIIIVCRDVFPAALHAIFTEAFRFRAAVYGALGGTITAASSMRAVRYGVSRGLFSNEAGLGTAGIAAGALPDGTPARQAMVSATATFWDTVVFCGVTGIAFVCAVLHAGISETDGAVFCIRVFSLIPAGQPILRITIALLGYACILGWCYIGSRAFTHALPGLPPKTYPILWTLAAGFGALFSARAVWSVSDLLNAAAALPVVYIMWRYFGQNHT